MFNFDFSVREIIKCDNEEKEKCRCIIDKIKYLNDIAQNRSNSLILENAVKDINEPLLEQGVMLMVDGACQDLIVDILGTKIEYGNKTGVELLKDIIILAGVLSIHDGDTSYILEEKLNAFLGDIAA